MVTDVLSRSLMEQPGLLSLTRYEWHVIHEFCYGVLELAGFAQLMLASGEFLVEFGISRTMLPKLTGSLWFAAALFIVSAISPAVPLGMSLFVVEFWVSYRCGALLGHALFRVFEMPDQARSPQRDTRRAARTSFAAFTPLLAPFTPRGRSRVLLLALLVMIAGCVTGVFPNDNDIAHHVFFGVLVAVLLFLSTAFGAARARPLLRHAYRFWCRSSIRCGSRHGRPMPTPG